MNEFIDGAELRAALIAARQLVAQGQRQRAAQLSLDSDAIAHCALEIVAVLDVESARAVALDGATDHRVGAVILELLELPESILRDRLQGPRARAKREWQPLGLE
jgi:hypothetical protein